MPIEDPAILSLPRFSFGMIVFNGEPFLEAVLDSIYDFAHEIIVIEGPDRNARPMARPDGRSVDKTCEILRRFPDPAGKIKIIHGVWRDKDEQSNRYIAEATGDYIWQVDDDEVYKREDLQRVAELLRADPAITAVSFYWQNFFKSFDRVMVAEPPYEVWRLFRLRPGYRFSTHRPPTVVDPASGQSMNALKPLHGAQLAALGIYVYHYSYLFDRQVEDKMRYHTNYRLREAGAGMPPVPSWLRRSRVARSAWQQLWRIKAFDGVRKRLDGGFHYNYFDKIWRAWDADPQGVEARYGVSPGVGPYRRTAPFSGTHPEAILKRFPAASR